MQSSIHPQTWQLKEVFSTFDPQILARCDLCLLQEVRDLKGEAVQALVKNLNRYKLASNTTHMLIIRKWWIICDIKRQPMSTFNSFVSLSADSTRPTLTHISRVKGWGGRPTKSSMCTSTGNLHPTWHIAVHSQVNMTTIIIISSFSSLLSSRSNVLKVKEHYQYPKQEAGGDNGTDVFSREPFIVRFHSPTTCTMKHHQHYQTSAPVELHRETKVTQITKKDLTMA